ncbi:MAG: hypothetical protein IJ693_05995 [Bacteroidaceae bacterium]|nr:hypothetical protein [Bacteroidaceae bacterium]
MFVDVDSRGLYSIQDITEDQLAVIDYCLLALPWVEKRETWRFTYPVRGEVLALADQLWRLLLQGEKMGGVIQRRTDAAGLSPSDDEVVSSDATFRKFNFVPHSQPTNHDKSGRHLQCE